MRSRLLTAALIAALGAVTAGATAGSAEGAGVDEAASAPVAQAGRHRAAVVVDLGGGDVRTACVSFDAASISGVEALRLAGFDPVVQAFGGKGTAVCALCGKGCSAGSGCLTCQQPDHWGYWPGYRYSSVGAGATEVSDGDVEAWRWGRSTSDAPTRVSYARICVPLASPTTAGPTTTRPAPPAPPSSPAGPGPGLTSPPGSTTTLAPSSSSTASTTAPARSSTPSSSTSSTTSEPPGDDERAAAQPVAADGQGPSNAGDDGGGSVVPSAVGFAAALAAVGLLILRARRQRSPSA